MNPVLHPARDLSKPLGVFKLTLPHAENQKNNYFKYIPSYYGTVVSECLCVLKCGKTHAELVSRPSEQHLLCRFARKSQVCWCASQRPSSPS